MDFNKYCNCYHQPYGKIIALFVKPEIHNIYNLIGKTDNNDSNDGNGVDDKTK